MTFAGLLRRWHLAPRLLGVLLAIAENARSQAGAWRATRPGHIASAPGIPRRPAMGGRPETERATESLYRAAKELGMDCVSLRRCFRSALRRLGRA